MKKLLPLIIIAFLCYYTASAKSTSDSISNNISKILESLSKNKSITKDKKYCAFEYNKGSEPDVDGIAIKGAENQFVLGSIEDKLVSKLIDQFETFCKDCKFESSKINAFKKESSFLIKGHYSIELTYASKAGQTTNILCLIYGNERYMLFSFGYDRIK